MNIHILSQEKQNLFCCYKIAKLTDNKFMINETCQSYIINIDGKLQKINFWLQYNGDKNGCYIFLLKDEIKNENIFADKVYKILDNLKMHDPEYKCILIVNILNENAENYIEPYVFACCNNIHSIAVSLYNDNHIKKMFEIVKKIALS